MNFFNVALEGLQQSLRIGRTEKADARYAQRARGVEKGGINSEKTFRTGNAGK